MYLDLPPEIIDRALSGRLILSSHGEQRRNENFLRFHGAASTFPWRSQAKWIAHRLIERYGLSTDLDAAASVFRADLYRQHMQDTGADLPGASEKLEGAILHPTAVASSRGQLSLLPDRFFDGAVFDPDAPI